MKNQLDLIVAIVAAVLAIGLSLTFMFNKRPIAVLTAPVKINLADVAPPAGAVVYGSSLAGGGGTTGGAPAGQGGFAGGQPPSGPPSGSTGPRGRPSAPAG